MTTLIKVSLGVATAAGTGTVGFGGLYYGTRISIDNKIGQDFLGNEEEFNDSWKQKQKHEQLLEASEDSLVIDLRNIRKSHNTKPSESGSKALKSWCNSMKNESYKSIFTGWKYTFVKPN